MCICLFLKQLSGDGHSAIYSSLDRFDASSLQLTCKYLKAEVAYNERAFSPPNVSRLALTPRPAMDDREGRIYSLVRGVLEAVNLTGSYRMCGCAPEGKTAMWEALLRSLAGSRGGPFTMTSFLPRVDYIQMYV